MKAVRFESTGSLDELRVVTMPDPEPAPGEVLVRVEAAGLNPSDVRNVEGAFAYTTLPRVPGRDFAGVVVAGPDRLLGHARDARVLMAARRPEAGTHRSGHVPRGWR